MSVVALTSLLARARSVVLSTSPTRKCKLVAQAATEWREAVRNIGSDADGPLLSPHGPTDPPPRLPGRSERPTLVDSSVMPGPKQLGVSTPVYLLHALAHIELNAVDLYSSLLLAGAAQPLPAAFYTSFVTVAADEARHFGMLCERMAQLGVAYGDLPAHKGLWEQAALAGDDLLARIALTPLVQEARGLDAGPRLVTKLRSAADHPSAAIVQQIVDEEVAHVRGGLRWFSWLARRHAMEPMPAFHRIYREHASGPLYRPFNEAARALAGMEPGWYEPLAPPPRGGGRKGGV